MGERKSQKQFRNERMSSPVTTQSPDNTEVSITQSKMMLDRAPDHMLKVYFGFGGSDANTTNVKLLWHYSNNLCRVQKKEFFVACVPWL